MAVEEKTKEPVPVTYVLLNFIYTRSQRLLLEYMENGGLATEPCATAIPIPTRLLFDFRSHCFGSGST